MMTDMLTREELLSMQADLQEFQGYLKALHTVTMELAKIEVLDDLYRRVVELGRSALGFDRLGLLLLEDGHYMVGTYGTDEQGNLRDERGFRTDVIFWDVMEVLRNRERAHVWPDRPLYDSGVPVGRGWSMMAALYDGDETIGWLATDNLIRREPLKDYRVELLTIFARSAGQLIVRKRADLALRENESLLRGVIENAADGILLLDASLRIMRANTSALKLLNLTEQTASNFKVTDFFGVDFLAIPFGTRQELPCTRPDGTTFAAETVLTELPNAKNTLFIFLIQDLTSRNAARNAIQEREMYRLALQKERELSDLKSRFISVVSHEFRTPLATLKVALNNLERYAERMTPADRREKFATMHEQIKLMSRLMEDVLLFGRLERGGMQSKSHPIQFSALVEHIVDEFSTAQPDHPITCVVSEEARPLTIFGDDDLIRQAVVNLLTNAAKYSDPGSPIAVGVGRGEGIEEGYVLLHVIDHGIGIPPAERERLFEPFQRAANVGTRQGTGLGLAIVKRAVDLHQGKIRVESVLDQGSTFTILLPYMVISPSTNGQRTQRNPT